jgi:RimJ/RimL family protein N-acetyltransferase
MIITSRLILRAWRIEDIPAFSEMCADPAGMAYLPKLLSVEETHQLVGRIEAHFREHGFGLYAVEKKDTETFIGFTGFMVPAFESFFTPCVEIGWRIRRTEWNQGFATEAAKACLDYGFADLGLTKVYSFTSVHNQASERVMQKIGLRREGTFLHPSLPTGHFLSEHLLYSIEKPSLASSVD